MLRAFLLVRRQCIVGPHGRATLRAWGYIVYAREVAVFAA